MKQTNLKIIRNEFRKQDGISEIIGRDAKEVLKRKPILETTEEKEKNRIDFHRPGLKWFTSLVKYL